VVGLAWLTLSSCSRNEAGRGMSRYCWVASAYKLTADEFFIPLQFKGVVRSITERENPGRRYVQELSLNFLAHDSSILSGYHCEQFFLDGSQESFVGMTHRMRRKANIGDSIIKVSGTPKFTLIT